MDIKSIRARLLLFTSKMISYFCFIQSGNLSFRPLTAFIHYLQQYRYKPSLFYKKQLFFSPYIFFLFFCPILLSACATQQNNQADMAFDADTLEENSSKSSMTLEAPQLPASLPQSSPKENISSPADKQSAANTPQLPYTITIKVPETESWLEDWAKEASMLVSLQKTPPEDILGLEYRIRADEQEFQKILHAFGYFDGKVVRDIDSTSSPLTVTLTLVPNTQFRLGEHEIRYPETTDLENLPQKLDDVGLPTGAYAIAEDIIKAIDTIPDNLKNNGYPFAAIQEKAFAINPQEKVLYADIDVAPGVKASMGNVWIQGTDKVRISYFRNMRTWDEGTLWKESLVDAYKEVLSQQGIFRNIEVTPILPPDPATAPRNGILPALPEEDATTKDGADTEKSSANATLQKGEQVPHDLLVTVTDGFPRSVGAGVNYDTDRGAGVQAYWEHRNFFSGGEKFRADLTLWKDLQNLNLSFRKPGFFTRNMAFVADAWLRREDTDAFMQRAVWLGAGIEYRLGRYWWLTAKGTLEAGELEDNENPLSSYSMIGLPLQLRFDTTTSPLNAEEGVRILFHLTPYVGTYREDFTLLIPKLEAQVFLPLWEKRLILALRGAVGSLLDDNPQDLPASVRFYAGGAGSVRGYAYQSLGEQDSKENPLGGASLVEMNAELRLNITKNIGLVAFLDGGNVYTKAMPEFDKEIQWGAGLGLRYHTPIGPLRLDVALPVNPRPQDSTSPFFYLSIGQSF